MEYAHAMLNADMVETLPCHLPHHQMIKKIIFKNNFFFNLPSNNGNNLFPIW